MIVYTSKDYWPWPIRHHKWRFEIHKVTIEIFRFFLHIQKLEIFIFYVGTSKILDLQNFPPRGGVKVGHFFLLVTPA